MGKGVVWLSAGAVLIAVLTMLQPHLATILPSSFSIKVLHRSETKASGLNGNAILSYPGQVEWQGVMTRLSWSPRAYHIKGLLTDEECEHIKKLAAASMTASQVVDTDAPGGHTISNVRTSTGTFISRSYDEVISGIEDRVAMVTMLPKENFEDMQVLKYVDGQKYEPHHDWFADEWNKRPEIGGQRVVTMLMYLATPEEGGETVFPNVDPSQVVKGDGWSDCARQGLAHKPVKGDALMFYSLTPNGKEDDHSLHASCPTLKGEKWSATFWIHVDKYLPDGKASPDTTAAASDIEAATAGASAATADIPVRVGDCSDKNADCTYWAQHGNCAKETYQQYMIENCPYSCKFCIVDDAKPGAEAGDSVPGSSEATAAEAA